MEVNKEEVNRDHEYCLRCGRKLKNPMARERGYGAVCEVKMRHEKGHRLFLSLDGNKKFN